MKKLYFLIPAVLWILEYPIFRLVGETPTNSWQQNYWVATAMAVGLLIFASIAFAIHEQD